MVCEGLDEIQLRPIVTRSCYQPMTIQRVTLSKKMVAVTCLVTMAADTKYFSFFTVVWGQKTREEKA